MTLIAAALMAAPAAAPGSIKVGSDLGFPAANYTNNCILSTPPCTVALVSVHDGNPYPLTSPTKGTVTAFTIKSSAADTVTFRLFRQDQQFDLSGAGTGPKVTLPAAGTFTYPTSLPIAVGDGLALDTSSTRAAQALPCGSSDGGASFNLHPVLVDGGPFQQADSNSICELLIQATVEPSNAFGIGKIGKVKRGKAILPVTVPGPGTLSLTGKGVRPRGGQAGAVTSQAVSEAGRVKLRVRLRRGVRAKLADAGKVKAKVEITFSPTGGVPMTKKLKLKLKR